MSDRQSDSVPAAANDGRLGGAVSFKRQGWQNPYCNSSSITVRFGRLKPEAHMHHSFDHVMLRPAGKRTGAGSASVLPFLLHSLAGQPQDRPPLCQVANVPH